MAGPRAKVVLVVLVAAVLHQTLFAALRVGDVRPHLLLLVAVAGAIVGGPVRGPVVAFCCGLLTDLFLQTPLGVSALAFSLVAFAVGTVQSSIIRSTWWIPPVTTFLASVAAIVAYALLAAIVGQSQFVRPVVLVVAVAVGGLNAVLAPLVVKVVTWSMTGPAQSSFAR